jgi:hypothetical protein
VPETPPRSEVLITPEAPPADRAALDEALRLAAEPPGRAARGAWWRTGVRENVTEPDDAELGSTR